MEKKRILYITSELSPYFEESEWSKSSIEFPKKMQEEGHEVRIFMPRFGIINERRYQLHEVIRLSGMNITVNDIDQPLIIKVASIPSAKLQVYFIDNEEYFKRKAVYGNAKEIFFKDNDERIIFFARGVIETLKKLKWMPDVIHIQGWFGSLLPLYLKTVYSNEMLFSNAKIVYSPFGDAKITLNNELPSKIKQDGIKVDKLTNIDQPTIEKLHHIAIEYADGVLINKKYEGIINTNKNTLFYEYIEELKDKLLDFYLNNILVEK